MEYGKLLSRTWDLIWNYKFLIILGVLVALGSGMGSGSSSGSTMNLQAGPQDQPFPQPLRGVVHDISMSSWWILLGGALLLIVALIIWIISTLARGGLIAGVRDADSGASASFSQAWSASWSRGWQLLGIAIVPAIPGLALLFLAGMGFLIYANNISLELGIPMVRNVAPFAIGLLCLFLPLTILLDLLRIFANRACVLEERGVFESYRRGLRVLGDNLGAALVLFLIQILTTIVMIILLILPGAILALCCLLWPILFLVQGAVTAFFSAMWTLAWNEWDTVAPLIVN